MSFTVYEPDADSPGADATIAPAPSANSASDRTSRKPPKSPKPTSSKRRPPPTVIRVERSHGGWGVGKIFLTCLPLIVLLGGAGAGGWYFWKSSSETTVAQNAKANSKTKNAPETAEDKQPEAKTEPPADVPKTPDSVAQKPVQKAEPRAKEPDKKAEPVANADSKAVKSEPSSPTPPIAKADPKVKFDQGNFPGDPGAKPTTLTGPTKTPDGAMTFAHDPKTTVQFSALSPDNKTLYTVSVDGPLIVWDLDTFKERDRIEVKKGQNNFRFRGVLSPDGKTIAYTGNLVPLHFLDLESKKSEAAERPKKLMGTEVVQYSMDGSMLIAKEHFGLPHLWDAKSRKYVRPMQAGEQLYVTRKPGEVLMRMTTGTKPDQTFKVGSLDGGWDGGTELKLPNTNGYRRPFFSPSGKKMAVTTRIGSPGAAEQRGLLVLDWETKKPLHDGIVLPSFAKNQMGDDFSCAAFSPDETKIIAGVGERTGLHLIDVDKGVVLGSHRFEPASSSYDGITNVFWTPDDKVVVTYGPLVKVWNARDIPWEKLELPSPKPSEPPPQQVAKVEILKPMASKGNVKLEPVGPFTPIWGYKTTAGTDQDVSLSPDGKLLAHTISGNFGDVTWRVVDLDKQFESFVVKRRAARGTQWSGDGSTVAYLDCGNVVFAAATGDKKPLHKIVVMDARQWEEKATIEFENYPLAMSLSGDGSRAILYGTQAVETFDLVGKKRINRFEGFNGERGAILLGDGKTFAIGGSGGVSLVDFDTGKPRAVSKGGGAFDLTPDGTKMVQWDSGGKKVRISDVSGEPKLLEEFDSGIPRVYQVKFLSGGKYLALHGATKGDAVRFHNGETGAPLETLKIGKSDLTGSFTLSVPHEGNRIVTYGVDRNIRVWETPFGEKK